jgi:hypothetical protein
MLEDATVTEAAHIMAGLKEQLEDAKAYASAIQKDYDILRKTVLPAKMEDAGLDSMVVTGVGRINVRPEMYTSVIKGQNEEAHHWLRENGYDAIVKETVNSSSLKAILKECMKEGTIIPDNVFKVTPYEMATITKT